MSTWLDQHIEEFIKPHLGEVPEPDPKVCGYVKSFDKKHLSALQAVWKEAKKRSRGRQILLAGRDVWLFEVLARMEDYYTVFRSDISSISCVHKSLKGIYTDHFLLDTGNRGTVPMNLGMKHWVLIYCSGPATGNYDPKTHAVYMKEHQVFPHKCRGPVYNLYSHLEGVQKYWNQATIIGDKIVQQLYDPKADASKHPYDRDSFLKAAMVTLHVARSVSPRQHRSYVFSVGRGL